ncbi:type VI secretion system accessory protein TagJ [Photobacterium sanguinicancri]|uniref:Protein of avirulence locus ImpE n=1 Tax=Photobacterium sanguinicancri TaxID=875932 RepID=A0ABX4FSF0_9GAMM|nr:type VI secretion system accessory protein TagJ [Photobacterium sanguinicancri]OZS41814.1 protein of avirulence locus ImpE [Photobacterium sanguinicancri]
MESLNIRLQQESIKDILCDYMDVLKSQPKDSDLRSNFIELLCIDGQLERADQQLSLLIKQYPEYLVGGNNLRQLIHAAQARADFFSGNATVQLLKGEVKSFESLVALNVARCRKDDSGVKEHAEKLELERCKSAFTVNNISVPDCRDLDDSLAGYIELFGTDGQYYLVPFSEVSHLQFMPITSLVEYIWRKVSIEVIDGPSGDAFLPITYIDSKTDAQKLARETDWVELPNTPVVIGQGQKMWLVGDEALPLAQCELMEKMA